MRRTTLYAILLLSFVPNTVRATDCRDLLRQAGIQAVADESYAKLNAFRIQQLVGTLLKSLDEFEGRPADPFLVEIVRFEFDAVKTQLTTLASIDKKAERQNTGLAQKYIRILELTVSAISIHHSALRALKAEFTPQVEELTNLLIRPDRLN